MDVEGDDLTFSLQGSGEGQYGQLSVNADGSYTFDPTHADYDGLADGATRDLNVVTSQEKASGAVALLEPGNGTLDLAASHGVTLLYVLRGAAQASVGGADWDLGSGDVLRL